MKGFNASERLICGSLVVLMCGFALFVGVRTTGDLNWGLDDYDTSRDLAAVEAILNGNNGRDPVYTGEIMWYNPLVPLLVAGIVAVTNLPAHLILVRVGAYLNLLAPLAFYFMTVHLFNRKVGLAATMGFLFVGTAPKIYPWVFATYSPWLYPTAFTQAFFYLTITALVKAVQSQSWKWHLVTGGLLGLTFLGHTAPAVILAGLLAFLVIRVILMNRPAVPTYLLKLSLVGITALIIALPFLGPLFSAYHFRILNREPGAWVSVIFSRSNIVPFLESNVAVMTVVGIVGFLGICYHRIRSPHTSLLMVWGAIAGGGIAYEYLRRVFGSYPLPTLFPGIHFLLYFRAFVAVLFGCGLVLVGDALNRWLTPERKSSVYLGVLMIGAFAVSLPAYLARYEHTGARENVQQLAQIDKISTIEWIQANTDPNDVFVAPESLGLSVVAPAGCKLVVVNRYFSNPYVDWEKRNRDNEAILGFLEGKSDDKGLFELLVNRYTVKYIILSKSEDRTLKNTSVLSRVFACGRFEIYGLRQSGL